jgi:hypothetical protein
MPMVNDANNSKLDQAIKQTLSNYEAPYNAADWEKMESMLDAAPKSVNFKWSYSLNILIGILVLGGIYLIYNSINSSKKIDNTKNTEAQQPAVESPVNTITTTSKPLPVAVPPPVVSTATVTAAPVETPLVKEETTAKKEPVVIETKSKKTEEATDKNEKIAKKPQRVFVKGNEPVFGDMLDSSKGIVGKTKEKEETKKAVKAHPDNSIGWNSFLMKTNLDSLKKYHDQQQKDSLKK